MDQSLSFQPLLFGGDINVYSVARAFHEAYGVRSVAFGKYPSFPCHGSAIIDYRVCPDNESDEAFLRNARAGKDSHSLVYSGDASLKRRLRILKNHIGNIKRFDQYNKVPEG